MLNFVERAQALMQSRTAALAIVPLAAALAAPAAEATPVLPSSNPTCGPSAFAVSCVGAISGGSLANGAVSFSMTSGSLLYTSGGGIVSQSGVMNEAYVGDIPISYAFALATTATTPAPWTMTFTVSQFGGGTYSTNIVFSPPNGQFSGTTSLVGVSLLQGFQTDISFSGSGYAEGLSLDFQQTGSIVFGPIGAPTAGTVPEPASLALVLTALGAALRWRKPATG